MIQTPGRQSRPLAINKDHTVWLDGSRPPPTRYILKNKIILMSLKFDQFNPYNQNCIIVQRSCNLKTLAQTHLQSHFPNFRWFSKTFNFLTVLDFLFQPYKPFFFATKLECLYLQAFLAKIIVCAAKVRANYSRVSLS